LFADARGAVAVLIPNGSWHDNKELTAAPKMPRDAERTVSIERAECTNVCMGPLAPTRRSAVVPPPPMNQAKYWQLPIDHFVVAKLKKSSLQGSSS